MLFHKECRTPIVLDLSDLIDLKSAIILTTAGIKIGMSNLTLDKEKSHKFFCGNCNKNIYISDIVGNCDKCGNLFSVDNLYKVTSKTYSEQVTGTYCSNCCSKEDILTKISTSLDKLIF